MPTPAIAFTDPVGNKDRDVVVLGHSLGTSSVLWDDVVPLLAESYRVIRWELPGHGESAVATQPFTIGDERFFYAGVSIGGTVGIELALSHAHMIAGAAILAAGAGVDSPGAWAERAAAVRVDGTASLTDGSRQRWFAPNTHEHPERIERALAALVRTDDASYAYACEALGDYDVTDRLSEVTPPILALWGQYDQLVPERRSEQLAQAVRNGRVHMVAGAAHAAPLEQPRTVAAELTAFFAHI